MKKTYSSSLNEFTNEFINRDKIDKENIRATNLLYSPPDKNYFSIQKTHLAREFVKFPIPPHKVDFFEILIIKEGLNKRNINLIEFELSNKSFSITHPGQIVSDDLRSNQIIGYHIYFDEEFILQMDNSLVQMDLLKLENISYGCFSDSEFDQIENLLIRMEKLFTESNNENLLKSYFRTLLLEINEIAQGRNFHKINPELSKAHKFRRMLNLSPNNQISIEEYANRLNITPKYLHKIVKSEFGISPSKLKIDCIIFNSKYLLSCYNMTITQISLDLGFNDVSYFTRFFKKNEGITPTEWKNKNKEY